jgi:hypothetical protein
MTWGELSDDLTIWSLPPERTKNGTAHNVPLSAPVRSLLKPFMCEEAGERHASSQLVFPGVAGTPFAGWSKAKLALGKAIMGRRAEAAKTGGKPPASLNPWNVHDLRRTVATGLQRLGVRLEVTEAVLNHISGSRGGIAGVYQRHDWAVEKCAALEHWGLTLADLLRKVPPLPTSYRCRAAPDLWACSLVRLTDEKQSSAQLLLRLARTLPPTTERRPSILLTLDAPNRHIRGGALQTNRAVDWRR